MCTTSRAGVLETVQYLVRSELQTTKKTDRFTRSLKKLTHSLAKRIEREVWAYSLGVIMVAMTIGSQHARIRFPGLDVRAAGFCTFTLLPEDPPNYCQSLKSVHRKCFSKPKEKLMFTDQLSFRDVEAPKLSCWRELSQKSKTPISIRHEIIFQWSKIVRQLLTFRRQTQICRAPSGLWR